MKIQDTQLENTATTTDTDQAPRYQVGTANKRSRAIVEQADPTARFFHYGPQGCAAGWVVGKAWGGWETPITWSEARAFQNALEQLRAMGKIPADTPRETPAPRPGFAAAYKRAEPVGQDQPAAAIELTAGGMYPREVDTKGATLHSRHCQAAFWRRDWRCSRCCELMHGAAPRAGWQRPFFAAKLRQVQRRLLFPHAE